MRFRFRVIEAREPLALFDEGRLVALRQSLERQDLENGPFRRPGDLPTPRDETIDEERGPDLGGEDDLLLVLRRQDPRALGRIVAEDRGVEAREESHRRDRVRWRAWRL